ncbi:hypothetical protein PVA45_08395 (plasmid) [Entomospira entomophila]|uniref:Uncharacterized protein n=1 Tax=Entomospira entomophila TaxID=2719988 RepID=A0A968KTJ8_9SPIO|nr:hypothetical protein [Entomospira entomophilus]NIZ41522.1 hypothetical protein [Entomospira entomophilus]WDI36450.1 hypothetical protein PVA45_08395 [Entomospira entomophilus]
MANQRKITLSKAMYEDLIHLLREPKKKAEVIDAICRYAMDSYPKDTLRRILDRRVSTYNNESIELYISRQIAYPNNTIRSILAYQLPIAQEHGMEKILHPIDYQRYFTAPLSFKQNMRLDKESIAWLRAESQQRKIDITRLVEDILLQWHDEDIPAERETPNQEKEYIHIKSLSGAVRAWLEERNLTELEAKTVNAIIQQHWQIVRPDFLT